MLRRYSDSKNINGGACVNQVIEESSELWVKCQYPAYDFVLLKNVLLDIDLF